jgi:hypothetical protein
MDAVRIPQCFGRRQESVKLGLSPEAGVAQLVEQLIRNQQVIGSSPIAGSSFPQQISRRQLWVIALHSHDCETPQACDNRPR